MDIKKEFKKSLRKNGLELQKEIRSGSSGSLFYPYIEPVYDKRTVYTLKDLNKLIAEGFESRADLGAWVFNFLKNL